MNFSSFWIAILALGYQPSLSNGFEIQTGHVNTKDNNTENIKLDDNCSLNIFCWDILK